MITLDKMYQNPYLFQVLSNIKKDGGTVLLVTLYGAHLYGLATPESDQDFAVIFLPRLEDTLFGTARQSYKASSNDRGEKNTSIDIDVQAHSLGSLLSRFLKGEIVSFDLLYAMTNEDAKAFVHPEFRHLVEGYIYAKKLVPDLGKLSGFIGYINHQASKYGVKGTRYGAVLALKQVIEQNPDVKTVAQLLELPARHLVDGTNIQLTTIQANSSGGSLKDIPAVSVLGKRVALYLPVHVLKTVVDNLVKKYGHRADKARQNQGIDYKAISHAFRAIYEYLSYLKGTFKYPLPEDLREFLIKVKAGELPFTELQPLLEQQIQEVFEAVKTHTGPRQANEDLAKKLYKELYLKLGECHG